MAQQDGIRLWVVVGRCAAERYGEGCGRAGHRGCGVPGNSALRNARCVEVGKGGGNWTGIKWEHRRVRSLGVSGNGGGGGRRQDFILRGGHIARMHSIVSP